MRLRRRPPVDDAVVQRPVPRFVCRTCNTSGPFYVAREVVNWVGIGNPYRSPNGSLTYTTLNTLLVGTPGPPLGYLCGYCNARCDTLEELVLEPGLIAS
jgi:hypothetical protein